MNEAKLDAELQMALSLNEAQRRRSLDLDVGYDEADRRWELIIKYSGDLQAIAESLDMEITPLLAEYAIVNLPESRIGRLSEYSQIEYIEKPKALLLSQMEGIASSCISPVRLPPLSLDGSGVLIAVIDSGIDYTHPDFRNSDGTTRIRAIWDQSASDGEPPEGYRSGALYTEEDINRALSLPDAGMRLSVVPVTDLSGHGTHVASIAAGNGRASMGWYVGVAPEAYLLIVKLGPASARGFPRTSELMQAVDWCIRYAVDRNLPLAVNISYGNNYGDHAGTSLLEQYINRVANLGRTSICIGAGNEGNTARHYAGRIIGNEQETVEFSVGPFETGLNIQIWKEYADQFQVVVQSPSGEIVSLPDELLTRIGRMTDVKILYAMPTPYDTRQEIFISMIPSLDYIEEGIWKLYLVPIQIRSGYYNMWLPVSGSTSARTAFFQPTADLTLTIPSTAYRAITVGAYDSRTNSYAAFSGRGYAGLQDLSGSFDYSGPMGIYSQKPDLAAPGVEIIAASPGGGYTARSGTSMATPFVTGAAALLMQWGILQRNDQYLYGEKLKASLIRGTRKLPGFQVYPNALVGWGALCVWDSIF